MRLGGPAAGGRFAVEIRMVFIARALALLWAGFWISFFVAEGWAWRSPWRVMAFWAGVGLAFSILALLPWKWQTTGGVLLVVTGLLVAVGYAWWSTPRLPFTSRAITTVVFGGPPLVAGILFLIHPGTLSAQRGH
jgi:peptidoglycan/LPS O-acetylase OafA/YrhL